MSLGRRTFLTGVSSLAIVFWMGTFGVGTFGVGCALAEEPAGSLNKSGLSEPVYRVTTVSTVARDQPHSLDAGLELARQALQHSRLNYQDYTATLVKRERVDGALAEPESMFVKIRNRRMEDGQLKVPMSVYISFLTPSSCKGREVIWVENRNNGYITAHEGGVKGRFLPTVSLSPSGILAMRGQRYPMTEIGLENLIVKLIERGETARQYADVKAEFRSNARIKDRACTVLQVTQPQRHPDLDFYLAHIFIDDALQIPVRYVAYDWPATAESKPEVIEEYTYLDVKMNVGLTDLDFDPTNPAYNF